MKDAEKSKEQLMNELAELHQRVTEFEKSEFERKRAEEEIKLMQTATLTISETGDLISALGVVLEEVCETTGWHVGEAWIPDPCKEVLVHATSWNSHGMNLEEYVRLSKELTFPLGVGLPGRLWASGQPEWIPDVSRKSADIFLRTAMAHENGLKAGFGVPIIDANEVQAVLVFFMNESREDDVRLVELVSAVAAQLGPLIQRKRVEEELRESTEALRAVINASPLAIMSIDRRSKVTMWNPAAESIFGWTEHEVLGQFNPLPPLDKQMEHKDLRERSFSGETFTGLEVHRQRKDGTLIDVSLSTAPAYDAEGKIRNIMAVLEDITERKLMETTLQESVENFKSLAQNANDGILIAAGEGGHVYANKRAAEITGYSVDELLEIGLHEIVAPDEVGEVADRYKRRLAGENVSGQYETTLVKKGGKSFPAELSSAITFWKGESASIVIIHDITERKEVEQALLKREAELKVHADELEEVNTALRVLLKRREEDKTELEEKISTNVKELVAPCLERLRNTGLNAKQAAHVETLESNLTDIISPFAHRLSSKYLNLTPTEIQIANLIKEGRTTKEIAEMLNSSSRTVEFHRKNIRKKIGIINKKVNLRSHLLSM